MVTYNKMSEVKNFKKKPALKKGLSFSLQELGMEIDRLEASMQYVSIMGYFQILY